LTDAGASNGRPPLRARGFVYRRVVLAAQAFIRIEASSGIVLLAAALAALAWANSPWDESYFDFWHTSISIDADIVAIDMDLRDWINDGLMTIFFFLMGLEIKRELVYGELSSRKRAVLPAAAALGGMIAPAVIYTAFNAGGDGARGWGIPMATDIAFALGALSLLSRRIPFSVKVFLLAIAVADDIGAILVIAAFYSSELDFLALLLAAAVLLTIVALNRSGVRNVDVYVLFGIILWVLVIESGVHATIAGVVLGLMTPAGRFYAVDSFADSAQDLINRFRVAHQTGNEGIQQGVLSQMEDLSHGTEAPLDRLERALHPWVSFLIVPVFALANAGIHITGDVAREALESPVSQGVAVGLTLGKPIGIVLFTWLALKLHLGELPAGATWGHILGVGLLAGIGFTVALLITGLAFEDDTLADRARLGVLAASVVAGGLGLAFLLLTGRRTRHENEQSAPAT
jgi:Na+:H+ antiporter, NhaA family